MTKLQIYKEHRKIGLLEVDGEEYTLDTKDAELRKEIERLWKRGPILKSADTTKNEIRDGVESLQASEETLGFLDEELPAEYSIVEID